MKFLVRGATGKLVEDPSEKRAVLLDAFRHHLHDHVKMNNVFQVFYYFFKRENRLCRQYDFYAMKFFACEQLNSVALVATWFFTDRFLQGQVRGGGGRQTNSRKKN